MDQSVMGAPGNTQAQQGNASMTACRLGGAEWSAMGPILCRGNGCRGFTICTHLSETRLAHAAVRGQGFCGHRHTQSVRLPGRFLKHAPYVPILSMGQGCGWTPEMVGRVYIDRRHL